MSTTIDSLDIQITTSAGQAEVKIQALADALGQLKNQGKIGAATSAMKSLAKALDTLNPSLNALNPAKLQQLRATMSGLSGIQKASGLNNVVSTLKKIPDVIGGLDTSTLDKLELRLNRLARAIAPLARELDKVGTAFSRLPARVTQVVTATNRMATASARAREATEEHGRAINATSLNVMSAIHNFESMVHVLNIVTDALSNFMAQAIEWDGIQYRFGRAFGEDAEEVYQYVLKINDVLGINIQQFMQYSSLYGSLLSGFGMQQDKVTAISVGLTELSYDIWAAYNDRFKSLEDASEAVRSAITGEIEPIRNAGIALTEASMQEYLNSIGMAHVSIEKLTEAQKAEVRYAVMMNAAMNQGIVGTYASEMQTAEGAVRSLSQSLKSLTQALGSLFIPILQLVVPYLTAFVELLYEAVAAVASFLGISFFEIDWGNGVGDLASGMEDAADGAGNIESALGGAATAAKKLKNYTMGFDELNVISPPSASSSGGGAGAGAGGAGDNGWGDGLELDTLWDESVFAKASQQVDELKQKILDWLEEWKTEIAIVAGALAVLSVASLLTSMGEALHLGETFLGTMGSIKKLAATAIVITLQYTLMGEYLGSFIEEGAWKDYVAAMVVAAIGTGVLYSQWGKGGLVIGLAVTAVASFKATFADGELDSTEEVVTGLTGLATALGAIGLAWSKLKDTDFGMFFRLIATGSPVVDTFAAAFPKLASAFATIGGWISSAASAVGTFVAGISAPVWGTIVAVIAAIVSVVYFLYENWEKVKKAVKDFFAQNIAPKLSEIKKHFDKMGEALKPVIDFFKTLVEWIKIAVDWIVKTIGPVIEWLGGIIFSVVGGVIATAFNVLVGLIENVVQVVTGVVQFVVGVVEFIVALFSGGDIGAAWSKIWDGVVNVVGGIVEAVIGVIVDLVKGIISWFVELWDELVGHSIVPDTVNGIVEWFLGMPGRILGAIRDFVKSVFQKFAELWDSIKSWFRTNVAPKFTLKYWLDLFGQMVKGAAEKLGEVKDTIAEKWTAVKTWFTTNVAPKFTLKYWAELFFNIVAGLGEKLTEAWEKVKEFFSFEEWKKKVEDAVKAIKDHFKLPEFPKIKLTVEWDTNVGTVKTAVYKALGLDGWPKLKFETYATGGFPSMGQMFIAREAGPEMVGTIGSRSAVVNNDQIVEAVSRGVYSAVVAAMSSNNGNGSQNVNVYLDGKQIYTSVKRVEAERGVSVMGNQLGYAY